MPPTVIKELQLEQHGYKVTPFGPYYQAFPDGRSIKIYADDAKKNYESIAQFSKKDAETIPKWDAWLSGVADVMGPLLLQVPPPLGSLKVKDLLDQLRVAWKTRGLGVRGVADVTKLFSMSVSDLLDEWFESDAIKAMLTVNGVIGTWAGPDSPGTAYVMLHHSIGDVGDGHLGSWGFQEGGMGGVSDACRRAAESFGAEVRTNAKVAKILVRGGRAVGVALENGDELRAPVVVTTIHPKIAFEKLIDETELPGRLRPGHQELEDAERRREGQLRDQRAARTSSPTPARSCRTTTPGSVELCFSPEYAEKAFQDAHFLRKAAERPFVDGVIPTTLDKTLMPEGVHNFSMFTQWVPDDWVKEPHREELELYADRIVDLYTELAPNFKSSVIARQVIGPVRHGAGPRADRREHLPRRALGGSAVPHAAGARVRGLPDADQGPVPRLERDPRRRRRRRHPRVAGVPAGQEGPRGRIEEVASRTWRDGWGDPGDGPRSSACSRRARWRSSARPCARARSAASRSSS